MVKKILIIKSCFIFQNWLEKFLDSILNMELWYYIAGFHIFTQQFSDVETCAFLEDLFRSRERTA